MSKKVLFVDDDEMIRGILANLGKENNLDVTMAENGKDGIEKIQSNTFDAVFIDMHMPGMEGDETLKKMKETGKLTGITILMTGDDMTDDDAKKLGFDTYIKKPVKKKVFKEFLQENLKL